MSVNRKLGRESSVNINSERVSVIGTRIISVNRKSGRESLVNIKLGPESSVKLGTSKWNFFASVHQVRNLPGR